MKDLKKSYGVYIRSSMVVSIAVFIGAFIFVPEIEVKPFDKVIDTDDIIRDIFARVDDPVIPKPPDRDNRPGPPITDVQGDADSVVTTIDPTDYDDLRPFVNNSGQLDVVPYYMVQVKPKPVKIVPSAYPAICKQAGIEGTCVVAMLVNVDGCVIDVKILKSSGNQLLDQAAIAAARHAVFTPARQRDRLVRVWVAQPVNFQLK